MPKSPATKPSPILALGHQSRVGKNTAADGIAYHLRREGVTVVMGSFAALLKRQAHQLWGHLGLEDGPFYETEETAFLRDTPLANGRTPVELWIAYGQAVRAVDPGAWIAPVLEAPRPPGSLLVITDLRFDNEGDAVHARGGFCLKVEREGTKIRASDKMIRPDFPWDARLLNDGSWAELRGRAAELARGYIATFNKGGPA